MHMQKEINNGALLVFNEKNDFETLLSNYNFDIYSLDEIKVDKNEFVSNFSYNKSIIKLLSNNLQLSNYISNTVTVTLLRDGGIQFDGITYFSDSDLALLNYDPTLDNYIGTNEIFSRTVANRVLNKIYEYQLLLVKLFSNQVTPPQQQVNILSPGLRGLMLEDFPGNANGYYRLEQGKTNRDAILLEDGILQQQEVVAPPAPTFKPDVIEILCPSATTPDSNTDMFSVGNCSPPLDLLSFPEGYDQMYFLVRGADEYYTSDTARALDPDSPLVKVFTHIGSNNYNTINQNNKWRVLINFNMYQVPFDPKNVGPWDYVAIDTTSYKYNKNENVETEILDPEAGAASGSS